MADRNRTGRVDWEDVRFFVALARHGSLSATARATRVNHATVARRIGALEDALGIKLFERLPGGYELTAAGRNALQAADAMDSAAMGLSQLEPEGSLTGLVRITSTPSLAEAFLIPRLVGLHQEHPQLRLEVTSERRTLSLKRYQSDIALRFARPEKGEVTARRVVNMAYRFYATAAWRGRIERGQAPRFVGFDEAGAEFPEALWLAQQFEDPSLALRCNSLTGQIAAVRAGFGVALLPRFLAVGDPGLVEVSLGKAPPTRELWLVTRRDVRTAERIRVVADYLVDVIQRERKVFEGK